MSKSLVVREMTPDVWRMIETISPSMYASRLFGMGSDAQAAAIMVTGHELGFGLSASFRVIHIIQGKPSISPAGALALIRNSGLLASMQIVEDASSCSVSMTRKDTGECYQLRFSIDDAKRAGLVKPDSGWARYPANMLRWRAIGYVADVLFADVLAGLKRADEFGAEVDSSGNVIEGQWSETPNNTPVDTPVVEAAPIAVKASVTLDELVNRYGVEAIMAAFGGGIPGTDDQVLAVAAILEQSNV